MIPNLIYKKKIPFFYVCALVFLIVYIHDCSLFFSHSLYIRVEGQLSLFIKLNASRIECCWTSTYWFLSHKLCLLELPKTSCYSCGKEKWSSNMAQLWRFNSVRVYFWLLFDSILCRCMQGRSNFSFRISYVFYLMLCRILCTFVRIVLQFLANKKYSDRKYFSFLMS